MFICPTWKTGNSLVVTIPKAVAEAHEIREKTKMALRMGKKGELIYRKLEDVIAEGKKGED